MQSLAVNMGQSHPTQRQGSSNLAPNFISVPPNTIAIPPNFIPMPPNTIAIPPKVTPMPPNQSVPSSAGPQRHRQSRGPLNTITNTISMTNAGRKDTSKRMVKLNPRFT
jgi:hypothetical protein